LFTTAAAAPRSTPGDKGSLFLFSDNGAVVLPRRLAVVSGELSSRFRRCLLDDASFRERI